MGEFLNGKFDGLGRKHFDDDNISDGIWKEGQMYDVGIVFVKANNSFTLGCFYQDEPNIVYHKGEDFPSLLISKT